MYQRDAKTPNVGSYIIVGLTGVWRVYSLRLTRTQTQANTRRLHYSRSTEHLRAQYHQSASQSLNICMCGHDSKHSSLGPKLRLWNCLLAHRHVSSTASAAGFSFGVDQAAADSKIAELDLAFSVQQDVWGFHVSVDDTMLLLQIQQSLHYLRSKEEIITLRSRRGRTLHLNLATHS